MISDVENMTTATMNRKTKFETIITSGVLLEMTVMPQWEYHWKIEHREWK